MVGGFEVRAEREQQDEALREVALAWLTQTP
jgi:hypothetical protein